MSPRKTTPKKKYPLPQQVDFDVWKLNLAGLLKRRSRELTALNLWAEHHSAYFVQIGHSELSGADALLETIFESTQPEIASEHERRKHDFSATKIRELLPEIESTIGALKTSDSNIVPKNGILGRRFGTLHRSLEAAANQIRWALIVTGRPHMRSADVVSHCVLFLATLHDCGVSEADAYALTSLLMEAHGFSPEELAVFGTGAVQAGTIRKRVKAAREDSIEIREAQRDFLQGRSGRQSDFSGVFDFPWRNPAPPRKIGPE